MSRKSIVQKSKSQLNTNQNVVNRMAKKNFEIYEFWLGLIGMSWHDAIGLSLTSRDYVTKDYTPFYREHSSFMETMRLSGTVFEI